MGSAQPRRIEERIAREVALALALLALVVVQTALLPRPLGVAPNIVLMLVVCQALLAGLSNAARWAFYGGLGLDLCANSAFGSHALALLAAVLAAGLPLMRISRDNWLLPLLGMLLGACAYHAALALVMTITVAPVPPRLYALVVALPAALMALIPVLPLFLYLRWIERRRRGEVPVDVY